VVVGLHLEADVVPVVEADHAGVIFKDAHAPVVRAEPAADLLGRPENGLSQEVVEKPAVEVDLPLQSFVGAVLRPGLGDRFQLHVGRVAPLVAEVSLDGPHFHRVEGELAGAAELLQGGVVQVSQGRRDQPKGVGGADAQVIERE
jgi:hypothetical protein